MNRLLLLVPALLCAVLFVGCTAEPEYVPPADAIPNIPPSRGSGDVPAGSTGAAEGGKLAAPPR